MKSLASYRINEKEFEITIWPFITWQGNIQYQGVLKLGEVTMYHVTWKESKEAVRDALFLAITKGIESLSTLSLDMGRKWDTMTKSG